MKITKQRLREIVKEELQIGSLEENDQEMVSIPKWVLEAALDAFNGVMGQGLSRNDLELQKAKKATIKALEGIQSQQSSAFSGLGFSQGRE